MRRLTRGVRILLTVLGALFVVGALASLIIAQTSPGQALALRQLLDRAGSGISGELEVAAITSTRGLFNGFTLHGVQLSGADGEPIVMADSARVGYELLSLFATRTAALRLYRPELSLARLDDGRWNLLAALERPSETDTAGAEGQRTPQAMDSTVGPSDSTTVGLEPLPGGFADLQDLRIVNGTVRIQLANGEWMVYDSIEAVVPQLDLGLGRGPDRAEVSFLSMRGHFREGLLDLRSLRGTVHRTDSVLELSVDRIELAESQGQGTAKLNWASKDDLRIAFGLDVRRLALADLRWLDSRIPEGSASGAVEAQFQVGTESEWRFSGLELQSGLSRISGSGGLRVRPGLLALETVDVRATDFELHTLSSWLPPHADSTPGWLTTRISGPIRASGPVTDLAIATQLDLWVPGATSATVADLRGNLVLGDNPGANDLRVVLKDVALGDLGGLIAARPSATRLAGTVNIDMRVSGRLNDGLVVTGDLLRLGSGGPSVLRLDGTVSRTSDGWPVRGLVLFEPLRMDHLAAFVPAAELRGSVTGSAQLSGTLDDLTVRTNLDTSGGPLDWVARVNVFAPTQGVRIAGPLEGIELSALSGRLPEPTRLRGSVNADMVFGPIPMGRIELDLVDSSVGALRVHRGVFGGTARNGVFEIDSLDVRTSAMDVSGTGTLALLDTLPAGQIRLKVSAASLEGLRPFLFGDSILVAEDLDDFEADIRGIDRDTLPSAEDVRVAGTAGGDLLIAGHLASWSASGQIALEDAVYRRYEADSATVELTHFHWPSRAFELDARSGETRVWGRAYRSGELDIGYGDKTGRVAAALVRSPDEDIRVRAGFFLGDSTTTVNLDQATIRSGGERWNLGGPASGSWGPDGIAVSDFRLLRPGPGGLRLTIDGTLPRSGDGDLRVSALNVDLGLVARVLQYEDAGVGGDLDLRMRIRGSPDVPRVNGTLDASDVRFRSVELSDVGGELRYANQALSGDLTASVKGTLALSVQGTLPAELAFWPGFEVGLVDAPLDLAVQADSVPLDAVLGFFDGYDEVEGSVSGAVAMTGRPSDLQPEGALTIANGAATIDFFGIRPEAFNGLLTLSPDGGVTVDATFREGGVGRVTGVVDLNPYSDPGFDLDVTANGLRAVARRDIEGMVTGSAHLGGSFQKPIISGGLTVDEGTLFIDEFVRSAEVLDLTDPLLREVFDTTFSGAGAQNDESSPFVRNLLADVSLTMVRNTWLRSQRLNQSMNVELSGTLDMTFDRQARTVAMLGELQAVRGTYTTLGRNFSVEEGTVRFVGTPGVNPDLDFTADFRVPRPEGPLDIVANVSGDLLQPSLRLSSEDQALSESDLYSYLVFGQPAYALSSGQLELVDGARQASVNLALGTIASQLGSFLLAEDFPIDYLDISTSQFFDGDFAAPGLGSEVRSTGITVGKYVSDDVFLGVRWRPFGNRGDASRNSFSGRLEWRFRDEWALEAFAEDRSLRDSFQSLDPLSFDLSKVFGVSVFWAWGY